MTVACMESITSISVASNHPAWCKTYNYEQIKQHSLVCEGWFKISLSHALKSKKWSHDSSSVQRTINLQKLAFGRFKARRPSNLKAYRFKNRSYTFETCKAVCTPQLVTANVLQSSTVANKKGTKRVQIRGLPPSSIARENLLSCKKLKHTRNWNDTISTKTLPTERWRFFAPHFPV